MRAVVDLVLLINGIGAIIGFTGRSILKKRRDRVDEHIRQLEDENERYDRLNRRLTETDDQGRTRSGR